MEHGLLAKSPRIEVVDALRGFAVMAIMLLHNIEHFNFSLNPQLHSRSATYIKRNGLLIRKITIKSSRPFQCAYHPLTP